MLLKVSLKFKWEIIMVLNFVHVFVCHMWFLNLLTFLQKKKPYKNIHKILHRLCGDKMIWIFFRLTWTGLIRGKQTALCRFSPANTPENHSSHKCTEDDETHKSSENCPSNCTVLCRETKRCEDWKSNFLRCLHKKDSIF